MNRNLWINIGLMALNMAIKSIIIKPPFRPEQKLRFGKNALPIQNKAAALREGEKAEHEAEEMAPVSLVLAQCW